MGLRIHRKENRWADKDYKKANFGTALKCNPFGGSSHCKGIVLEKVGIEAKQPNSAIRKSVRVQLIKNGKRSLPSCPVMVASTSSRRTTRSSWLGSVGPAMLRVTFPGCVSRSPRFQE